MRLSGLAPLLLMLAPFAAAAQEGPPEREEKIVVYGDDPCPKAENEEDIVICARKPESERFRIPRELREIPRSGESNSWASRAADLEEEQRSTRPGGCSVDGSYGQTGCFQEMIRQWQAERRSRRRN